ncbi:putative fatty acyl-CoA reductase 4 [Sesamum alatum]|uniref:Fatty acyl-CoA reductase n=1 Tax=Sesamum alatum TaxID=300844 RepID=A0AAE1Z3H4_9LAMI|nr:putative fatty acyl-CoA reductase 4 [Sesamum alatum]
MTSEQRLQEEVVDSELFRVLKEEYGEGFGSGLLSKVIPISGDVSLENLGIVDPEVRENMWREIDIIVNSAATTKFDERYDVALGINALGVSHVRNFASKCSKLKMLLQVSTAFVHDTKKGLIAEKPFHMGETPDGSKISYLDINTEKMIIEEKLSRLQTQNATEKEITRAMKDLGIERAMLHGWPNTYVFTKAIGEMLLENFKKAKVVIIRPTIVTSTYNEPFPGWIEGVRTLDSIFVAYGKGKLKFFAGDPNSTLDMIPGDMVVNCMLAAMALYSNHHDQNLFIYHIGSSRRNPVKYAEVKSLMQRYLTENPLLDTRGRPIKAAQLTILSSTASFHNYIAIHYLPFLKILKLINMMFCNPFGNIYANARRRLSTTMRLTELYRPYLFSQGVFDDANTENLRRMIKGSNTKVVLNFDPKCIQWDEYFVNTHFYGLTKYVLK